MARVFITGGAGFIGYFISKKLLSLGHEVIIYDAFINYISPLESHYPHYLEIRLKDLEGKANIIRGDIRHRGFLVKALKDTHPEIVIHLAAVPIASISNLFSEDTTQINLNGTITVLESIRVVDTIKRFIYASSSFVYGNFQYEPADEKHPTNPIDLYGGTKLSGEILTQVFGKRFGIEYTIIRPSAVYGPTDCNRRVSQIFIENALKGVPLVLNDGGEGKVDFTYVEDTAKGFVLACFCDKAKNEIFNITRGEGRSAKEFASVIKKYIPTLKTIVKEANEVRPQRGSLDIDKAKKLLGYEPKYAIEQGIPKYIESIKDIALFK